MENGYINESGEILNVPVIPNPVPATDILPPETAVANIISQSVEKAKAEIEMPVEVSGIQAAELGENAKAELGSAGVEAGELFNTSLGTAIANTAGVSEALSRVADVVRTQAMRLSDHGTTAGKMFSSGLAAGIRAGQSSITAAARQAANAAVAAANNTLDIHSPSGVMMKSGGFFDQGFARGILKDVSTVRNAAAYMANMAVNAASIRNPAGRWRAAQGAYASNRASYVGATAAEIAAAMSNVRLCMNGRDVSEAMSDDTAYTQNSRGNRIAMRYGTIL